ncbi:MAG: hypothetical protein ACTSPY_00910 [Candidatus Helarchaeota archaeon]
MPKGIALIHWDDSIGAILDELYPDDLELKRLFNAEKVLFIFTSQTMGDITTERFSALFTDEFHIACYYGGRLSNKLLMLILEENEIPKKYREILKTQFYKILKNEDNSYKIFPKIFNEIVEESCKFSDNGNGNSNCNLSNKIKKVINYLKKNPFTTFRPQYNIIKGIYYPDLEKIIGNSVKIEDIFSKLEKENIINKKIVDNLIICPNCASTYLKISRACPLCSSLRIIEGNVIEHFNCGHLDFERDFIKNNMICLKCSQKLQTEGIDYQKLGHYHYCLDCEKYIRDLKEVHKCLNCRNVFDSKSISLKPIYEYYSILKPLTSPIFNRDEN